MTVSCQSCGFPAGLLGLKGGLCKKCRDEPKDATHASEVHDRNNTHSGIDSSTVTTRILMSAAHLYPNDFKDDLKERLAHPYKSPTPEFGIDVKKIYQELENAKGSLLGKSVFLFVVAFFAFFVLIQDPEDNWGILFPALALTALSEFLYARSAKKKIRKILTGENEEKNGKDQNDLSYGNVTIFGGYSPFVGSGFDLESWSFTINTKEAEDKQEPVLAISVSELHERIKERLQSLGFDDVKISDELYINGMDVNSVAHLLPDGRLSKPVKNLDKKYLISKINSNDKKERHYRVARISMWDGQLILSMHYRFLTIEDNLFCEARFFLLPPLKEKYLAINRITSKPTGIEFGENLVQSVFKGAFSWIAVIFNIIGFIQGGFMAERAKNKGWKREVECNRLYNYGWESSLREKWSSPSYERYFQKVDKDVALKLLTSEFLSALQNLLKEKNISTDQFSQATTKIVNEGVIISGGEVKAESFAVGRGAKIVNNAINAVKGRGAKS